MRIKTIIFLWLLATNLFGQQEGLYTQYMYNTSDLNAGYTGLREKTTLFLQHRNQWGGLDGAPQTSTLGFETSIPSKHIGVGLTLRYDEIGPIVNTKTVLNVAYHLQVAEGAYFSLGIKGIANYINFDYSLLHSYNLGDQLLIYETDNNLQADWGVGLLFNTSKYFVGISAGNLLQNNYFQSTNSNDASYSVLNEIHYYGVAGSVVRLNHLLNLKPGLVVTKSETLPLHVGLSLNGMYQQLLVAGLSWQIESAISWHMGVYITPNIFAGYSHDFDTTPFKSTHSGTNEVFLRFDITSRKQSKGKINLPRFF